MTRLVVLQGSVVKACGHLFGFGALNPRPKKAGSFTVSNHHLQPLQRRLSRKRHSFKKTLHSTAQCRIPTFKMLSRATVRASTRIAGRRGFHATRSQMSSPYHYAEGPYTNIPFNPHKKTFPLLFWSYAITGFSAPFLIAAWQTYKPKA